MDISNIYHDHIPDFMLEALESKAMQRLKKVGMNCGCEYTQFEPFVGIAPYSRYDHSIGVGLIVYHFTGDKKQTLAGLFHDIATPCFAHVIDFLNGDHQNQQSTEEDTKKMIDEDEDIQRLLKKLNLSSEDVCDYHMYPIADNDTPKLSSDRLEYTVGNMINYGFAQKEEAKAFYDDLTIVKNEDGIDELAFLHKDKALAFTEYMIRCASIYECDADRCMMEYLALLLKDAIEKKVIQKEDLYTTEDVVIEKLKADEHFLKEWNRFCSYSRIAVSLEPQEGYMRILAKKRYINALVKNQGRIRDLELKAKELIDNYRAKGFDYYIKAE